MPARSRLCLFAALALAACAPNHIDNARYRLPGGPAELSGTTAIVMVARQEWVDETAQLHGGMEGRHSANAITVIPPPTGGVCFIYLADTAAGLAALEHELWHCKKGLWHP